MLCTNCFDADFITVKKPYKIKINGVEKIINDIERNECPECGETVFTQSQAIALDNKRVELEFGSKPLLTPYQLKLLRSVLSLTLDQVSDILHIGKNSYGRWERGESEITPSMSLLIHNFIDRVPSAKVNLIETEMTKRILDTKRQILSSDNNVSLGKYIKDCEDYQAYQARRNQQTDAAKTNRFECPAPPPPTEDQEQRIVAQFLDLIGFRWSHTPNEGKRNVINGARLKAAGMKRGCPDILIFDRPPDSDYVGVAIELKRQKGGRLSDEQREWLDALSDRGWLARCCKGADEAIKFVREVYGK